MCSNRRDCASLHRCCRIRRRPSPRPTCEPLRSQQPGMSSLLSGFSSLFSLHSHASNGRLALLKPLLLLGANPDALDSRLRSTALHAASYNGHLDVVRYLVESAGASVTAQTGEDGWTPLHCAALNGYLPVVKYLCEERHVRTAAESNVRPSSAAQHSSLPRSFPPLACSPSSLPSPRLFASRPVGRVCTVRPRMASCPSFAT